MIKINPRKLYGSDGYAVQELLKIASLLYKAYYSQNAEEEDNAELVLPTKLGSMKTHK